MNPVMQALVDGLTPLLWRGVEALVYVALVVGFFKAVKIVRRVAFGPLNRR
jgi:hypothetical protein